LKIGAILSVGANDRVADLAPFLNLSTVQPATRLSASVECYYANFIHQAKSWSNSRRVVAKAEWHPRKLFPRLGYLATTLTVFDERMFEVYNRRGMANQYINERKYALKWTRHSCKSLSGNEVRLQLHALAYNLANFLRTLVLPISIAD